MTREKLVMRLSARRVCKGEARGFQNGGFRVNVRAVAARGCLPPGTNVCIAASANRMSYESGYFSGFWTSVM